LGVATSRPKVGQSVIRKARKAPRRRWGNEKRTGKEVGGKHFVTLQGQRLADVEGRKKLNSGKNPQGKEDLKRTPGSVKWDIEGKKNSERTLQQNRLHRLRSKKKKTKTQNKTKTNK